MSEILREPAECRIEVDDREISSMYPWLMQIRVDTARNRPAEFTLTLDSIRDETGQWSVQDAGIFSPWKKIRIEAVFGYRREDIVTGYIRNIQADYPENMGQATVTITGQDESMALDRQQVSRAWSTQEAPLTDGDIAKQIATRHNLDPMIPEPGLTLAGLNQDETDVEFLRRRAEANGYEFFIRSGTLYFGPARTDEKPQSPIMVYAGPATNCLNFSVNQDGHRPDQVTTTRAAQSGTENVEETLSPDIPAMGNEGVSSEDAGLDPFVWRIQRPAGATGEEARARAQARANENALKITGQGKLDGSLYGHVLLTNRSVYVDGVGGTYNGLYYVDQVNHTFSREGYFQQFRLLRNAVGDNIEPGGPNRLGGLA